MNETIHHLIKNNRKLFYTGQIRNKYKSEINNTPGSEEEVFIYTLNQETSKRKSLTRKGIEILQELFID